MMRRWLVLAGLLWLAGCATVPGTAPVGPPNEAAWQLHSSRLAALSDWELQGRIGIVNGKDGGSGSMDWKQQGDEVTFNFRGPFGTGALEVRGDEHALWVRSSRGDDFITTDPERDFAARLHVPLPVSSMRYWMLGLPDPQADFTKQLDAKGDLVTLEQRGWHVDYQTYALFDGYELPTRLLIRRAPVSIKVAINQWQVGAAPDAGPAASR